MGMGNGNEILVVRSCHWADGGVTYGFDRYSRDTDAEWCPYALLGDKSSPPEFESASPAEAALKAAVAGVRQDGLFAKRHFNNVSFYRLFETELVPLSAYTGDAMGEV